MKRHIKFKALYYFGDNDYTKPYGTLHIVIQCGIVCIEFDIKPDKIMHFIKGILNGKEFEFGGRCDINAGHLNKELDSFQENTLVKIPEHIKKTRKHSDDLSKAFHKFSTTFGDRKEIAEELIEDLKKIYKL